jgi:hypothetical protein
MMMFLLQAAAHAASSVATPPPVLVETLGELSEVPSLTLDKGLLTADTAWLRDGTDCVEVQLQEDQLHGSSDKRLVSWDACPAGPFACTRKRTLGLDWGTHSFFHCERPDGSGWGGGSGSGSSAQAPTLLVRHDDQAAVWSSAISLQATFRTYRTLTRPCTPASAEHGTPSPDGPVQVCDASEGVTIGRVPTDSFGIGAKTSVSSDPIDCSLPCSVGEDHDAVRDANLWLHGRRFYEKGGPHYGIYATEALCMGASPSIPLARPDELCGEPIQQPEP